MHIYFSGIGGTAIGPLALIAQQAGYEVSGSDLKDSQYINYLQGKGIHSIHIGQTEAQIADVHKFHPIDWFIHSSAVTSDQAELQFCKRYGIKTSKRDELLNQIISDHKLKLIAIAGTHGKTTTTAMVVWLFKQLKVPLSYSVGAKISFGDMGEFAQHSEFFIYECDEFDRNFLAFNPYLSSITGIAWDHHEIFPTQEDYLGAFQQFLGQSQKQMLWTKDCQLLGLSPSDSLYTLDENDPHINQLKLLGWHNRANGWQAVEAVRQALGADQENLIEIINRFPGLSRRFEQITENLYSDYAHTPEKITGAITTALELAQAKNQQVVAVYEPLTNRRMHHTRQQHQGLFKDVAKLYWVPSYLAREDPNLPVLTPAELITNLTPEEQAKASPMELNDGLKQTIQSHLSNGDIVVCLSGGGGGSLDEWLRKEFRA